MDKITVDFVLEFIKEIKQLLEIIERDFNTILDVNKRSYTKIITKKSSIYVERIYNKYKSILDLEIETIDEISNLVVRSETNELIKIPESFILSNKFFELKKGFDNYVFLTEFGDNSWERFKFILFKIFIFQDDKKKSININTLEKIRFFMTFIHRYPEFDFENLPDDSLLRLYEPISPYWEIQKSYAFNYKNYIKNDNYFFPHHLNINLIPNYKIWNLSLAFLDTNDIVNYNKEVKIPYFPIQIFENKDKSVNSMIVVLANSNSNTIFQDSIVEKFSILNNFNFFNNSDILSKAVELRQNLIFESFVNYLDHLKTNRIFNSTIGTFEFTIDFRRKERPPANVVKVLNNETIKKYNFALMKVKSNIYQLYNAKINDNPYKVLFKNRFTFPDFNMLSNFLLIMNKKKNSQFNKVIAFLKIWSYQNIVYETKGKIIFYGYLLPNFDYSNEIIHINEIFEDANIEYKFFLPEYDIYQSNLSIYSLPYSKQFLKENLSWNLNEIKFPININEKNELMLSQLEKERMNN